MERVPTVRRFSAWRLAAALFCSGCPFAFAQAAPLPDGALLHEAAAALRPGEFAWDGGGAMAEPLTIVVSIALQRMYVYRGSLLVGVAAVSTGKPGHGTPLGIFQILQKAKWHRSNLYSNAPMPFMQRLTWGGIAIHAGWNPGYPASHGCVRVPAAFAKALFAMTTLGAAVSVTDYPEAPIYLSVEGLDLAQAGGDFVTVGAMVASAPRAWGDLGSSGPVLLDYAPAVFAIE